jgi:predicted metal-dependent hydrolase
MGKKNDKAQYRSYASKMREDLYRGLKLLSAAQGRSLQSLLEEAVSEYLEGRLVAVEERRDAKYTQLTVRMPETPYGSKKVKSKK